jgi:hypothetical protein
MSPYRSALDVHAPDTDVQVVAVFGKPESFVRLLLNVEGKGVVTVTLSTLDADHLVRAILIASRAAKAMDMK